MKFTVIIDTLVHEEPHMMWAVVDVDRSKDTMLDVLASAIEVMKKSPEGERHLHSGIDVMFSAIQPDVPGLPGLMRRWTNYPTTIRFIPKRALEDKP